ncbi:ATP-binding cassette domain-containing protein [Rhizorhabdus sp. FW153]|uniref:ATP-binding cassette domain-containing protein n=1 Tax=Rhizorhabdus sp. FW153 TaxID=3400216 RepID=UPI003CF78CAE
MTIAIRLQGRRGPRFLLDVDIDIPSTGVTALLGRSGSGKTSLLRALAGLDCHAGAISFGSDIWQDEQLFVRTERRRIGYVVQGEGLLPHLSVRRNLDFAERRALAGPFDRDEIIARTGIAPLLDAMPRDLSGGEMQRASIARALLGQPRLLLMDEPLSALDASARAAMVDWLGDLLPQLALPVIYVTHDEAEAGRLASTTLVLHDGRLIGG